MADAVQPGWSVRRKSGYSPNGFAFLTAAPGNGSISKDPYRWHPSSSLLVRRFSGKRSERRHALT